MVPRKLLEAFFSHLWILLIPVVLAPAAVLMLRETTPVYESQSTVWVDRSLDGAALVGDGPSWISPAQHQATALNDLLTTRRFRTGVAERAGILSATAPVTSVNEVVAELDMSVGALGANLVGISARSSDPQVAAKLVDAVTAEFSERFATEAARTSASEATYYEKQLAIAESELADREAALNAYVADNPDVADTSSGPSTDRNFLLLLDRVDQQRAEVSTLDATLRDIEGRLASAPQVFAAAFLVQDEAQAPESPLPVTATDRFGPPFAALLLGVAISAAYLYALYRMDHTVRSAEDVVELGVPFLGSVPELHPATGLSATFPLNWVARFRRRDFARHAASSIAGEDAAPGATVTVATNGRGHHG